MAESSTRRLLTPQELSLTCSDGVRMAAQRWRLNDQEVLLSKNRILCLHGWMDNCRTFHHLAPKLIQQATDKGNLEVVALDLVGHGLSSHKSLDGAPIVLAESVYYVAEALHQLGWIRMNDGKEQNEPVTLIGHSMGAAVSSMYAASFPEHVGRLVLLEGAGPLSRNPRDLAKHVRSHVDKRLRGNMSPRVPRVYPSLEMAVKTRCLTAKSFPGDQWLSTEAATEITLRGIEEVPSNETNNNDGIGYRFRHDPRLQWPSCMYATPEQGLALLQDIQCPTALLLAESGWPLATDRQEELLDALKPLVFETLPGSHHFHADPETADLVTQRVIEFLEST